MPNVHSTGQNLSPEQRACSENNWSIWPMIDLNNYLCKFHLFVNKFRGPGTIGLITELDHQIKSGSQRGGRVNFIRANNSQCFLANLSILITILDIMQTKSIRLICCGLSKVTPFNLILWKLFYSVNMYTLSKKSIYKHSMIWWQVQKLWLHL